MPLNRKWAKGEYFNPAWQKSLANALSVTHNCTIRVTRLTSGEGVFDVVTGKTAFPEEAVAVQYEGGARVQPRGTPLDKTNNAADTSMRRVQFQLPLAGAKETNIRPGSMIRVTECRNYPAMTTFDYRVQGVVNSGNPIEITIIATVDEEVVV